MGSDHFDAEIRELERTLDRTRRELRDLEAQWQQYGVELTEVREALDGLRRSVGGELRPAEPAPGPVPPTVRRRSDARRAAPAQAASKELGIASVPIDPDTDRSIRGARRDQLVAICEKLGKGGKTFRTIDVLKRVKAVEGEVSEGVRSYTYAIMGRFAESGFVEKVGRGKWRLV